MTDYAYRVYESIVQRTESELILFFVILAIATVALGALIALPLYGKMIKKQKAEREHEREQLREENKREREREKLIVDVIKENSTVMAGVKAVLESRLADMAYDVKKILFIVSRNHKDPFLHENDERRDDLP